MSAGSGGTGAAGRSTSDPGGSCDHRPTDLRPSTLTSSGDPGVGATTSASRSHAGTAAWEPPRPLLVFSPDSGPVTGLAPFWDLIVSLASRVASVTSLAGGTLSFTGPRIVVSGPFGVLRVGGVVGWPRGVVGWSHWGFLLLHLGGHLARRTRVVGRCHGARRSGLARPDEPPVSAARWTIPDRWPTPRRGATRPSSHHQPRRRCWPPHQS